MAKNLPYFKFGVASWINGNITLEDDSTQGLFVNICAHYWFKSGELRLSEIQRRLSRSKPEDFKILVDKGIIKVKKDVINIDFLDEQLNERGLISQKNSKNGRLGGRGKKKTNELKLESETKATALQTESETKPFAFVVESETKGIKNKNKNKNKNIEDNTSTSVDKYPFESSILGIIQNLKAEKTQQPVRAYKVTPLRVRMINSRKKDFDNLWPGRDFYKACQFAFGYKAKEWFGTDQFRYFEPETLLSQKFTAYLEKAEQDKGEPYVPQQQQKEAVVYQIPKAV